MAKNWPVGTLALCGVVAVASFLPWATVSMAPGGKGEGGMGDMLLALAGKIEGNAWSTFVSLGALQIPNWTIPVIAVFAGIFVALRAAGTWSPPRLLCAALVGFAELQATWMLVRLAIPDGTHESTVEIGLVVTLVSLAVILGIELRNSGVRVPERHRGLVAGEAVS